MRDSGRFLLFAPPQPPCTLVPGESVVIGRGASCDLTLPSPAASRRHAEVFPRGGGWALRDLDSTNGTFLNGDPVRASRDLAPGDVIRIGELTITFCRLEGEDAYAGEERTIVAPAHPVEQLRGDLAQIPPAGLLQMLELERKSGRLEIDSGEGKATLWIREGAPVHAEAGGEQGLDAACAIAMRSSGRFVLIPDDDPVEETLDVPMMEVVLEATRRLDEAGEEADPGFGSADDAEGPAQRDRS
jgi:pSer/pThr/pTyr-binding forkhead associated (FHA) protein